MGVSEIKIQQNGVITIDLFFTLPHLWINIILTVYNQVFLKCYSHLSYSLTDNRRNVCLSILNVCIIIIMHFIYRYLSKLPSHFTKINQINHKKLMNAKKQINRIK